MAAAYKLCRDCGAEFQPWVDRCTDCGGALDWAPQPAAEPSAPLPPTPELTCIRVADAWGARELAAELQSAGIPCRIDAHSPDAAGDCGGADPLRLGEACARNVGVFVRDEDVAAATGIGAALLARRSPELASASAGLTSDENACPACGAALDPAAPSCAACGLSFPAQ